MVDLKDLNKKYLIIILLVVVFSYLPFEIRSYPGRFFRVSECHLSGVRPLGCNPSDLNLKLTNCRAVATSRYIITDICECKNPAAFEYKFNRKKEVKVEFCSKFAGGDGVIAKVSNGTITKEKLVPPTSCRTLEIFSRGYLRFSVERYGNCREELIIWKALFFE